jgi:intergrase/recombinase|tara:strand:- start:369 stop:602 length:234 start_codon:yes stop_codon:yes gene_type:complete
MKIKSIKWSGRVMDTTHIGVKTGSRFVTEKAEVSDYDRERVEKIEEVNLTTYEIYYNKQGKKSKLRIFDPIEVLFTD